MIETGLDEADLNVEVQSSVSRRPFREYLDFSEAAPYIGVTVGLALSTIILLEAGLIDSEEKALAALVTIIGSAVGAVGVRILSWKKKSPDPIRRD